MSPYLSLSLTIQKLSISVFMLIKAKLMFNLPGFIIIVNGILRGNLCIHSDQYKQNSQNFSHFLCCNKINMNLFARYIAQIKIISDLSKENFKNKNVENNIRIIISVWRI